jgi:hypothetical protein
LRPGLAAVQALVEVAGDATGNLVQVGGLGDQTSQVVQLSSRELIQGTGDVGLGGIAQ